MITPDSSGSRSASSAIRVEECDGFPRQHAERIYALYQQTLARAEMRFETLTPQFFVNILFTRHCLRHLLAQQVAKSIELHLPTK